jgi:hypothetical protein
VRAYLAVSRKADFKQKATSQQPRCTPTSTCKHSQLAIRTLLAYNGLDKLFSMAVHATRRIRKVSVGLERQADLVAVVELAAVRMSDFDDEVIIASSSKENFGMKYDNNCKTVSTGKFSIFEDVVSFDEEECTAEAAQLVQEDTGIWSLESEDNEGEGGEEEEDLDLFA